MLKSPHISLMLASLRKLIDSWYPGYRGTLGTRAFTLIELLIVISILAILGSAISIVLNPAELLAEARDSQRINDLESLRNSLSLTLIDNPSLFDPLSNTSIYLSLPSSSCLTNPPSGYTYICNAVSSDLQKTDSTGWLPLSLTNLPVFPIDPVNSSSSSLYYAFVPDLTNKTFVLTSLLESEKYLKLSALKDGGTDPGRIEEGNPTLWTSASGLVGYWPMDEGSGSVAGDLSGNGNTGTFVSAPIWTAACISGSCLEFDNIDDGVNINNNFAGFTSYSVSAWVKPKGNHKNYTGTVLSSGNWNTTHWAFGINQSNTQVNTRNVGGTEDCNINGVIPVGAWTFLSYVRSGTIFNIYKDSVLIATCTIGSAGLASDYVNTMIGRETYAGGYFDFNGFIDEVKMINRPLSAAEIKAIYASQR